MNNLDQDSAKGSKSNIRNTRNEITDSDFESEVLQSDKPVIVHFSLDSEYDSKIIPILDELFPKYSNTVMFCRINMTEQTSVTANYGVLMAPTLLVFVDGKVVEQMIGAVDKETIATKLDMVLDRPSAELQELSLAELTKAYKGYKGQWNHAFISGLVSGIVFAIARSHFQGAAALIVPGLAIVFFIQNKNLGFSWLQKVFAIGLMFFIGMYWREILQLAKQLLQQ